MIRYYSKLLLLAQHQNGRIYGNIIIRRKNRPYCTLRGDDWQPSWRAAVLIMEVMLNANWSLKNSSHKDVYHKVKKDEDLARNKNLWYRSIKFGMGYKGIPLFVPNCRNVHHCQFTKITYISGLHHFILTWGKFRYMAIGLLYSVHRVRFSLWTAKLVFIFFLFLLFTILLLYISFSYCRQ